MLIGPGLSYVYFVSAPCVGLIKIGTARDPECRFAGLRCSSPVPLCRVALMPGGVREEKILHVRFRKIRAHGEWFHAARPLTEFIESRATAWTPDGETPREAVHARRDRAADSHHDFILESDRDDRRLRYEVARRNTKRSDIIGLA